MLSAVGRTDNSATNVDGENIMDDALELWRVEEDWTSKGRIHVYGTSLRIQATV